jgi:hypothetical protein
MLAQRQWPDNENGMNSESELRKRLRKIEALLAGATTEGERVAAEAAVERVRERLRESGRRHPAVEIKISLPDLWARQLFLALCRRYGIEPYRYRRQRYTTVIVKAPKSFVEEILWPEFRELLEVLQTFLNEVTLRLIREAVEAEPGEAEEVDQPLLPSR